MGLCKRGGRAERTLCLNLFTLGEGEEGSQEVRVVDVGHGEQTVLCVVR